MNEKLNELLCERYPKMMVNREKSMMEAQGANTADMTSLACVYEFKFKLLWATFEAMVAEGKFVKNDSAV